MKPNAKYYKDALYDMLDYDEKKHGSYDNYYSIISKSVDETIKFYEENYDFDDDEFDFEVFESDLINDARQALVQ